MLSICGEVYCMMSFCLLEKISYSAHSLFIQYSSMLRRLCKFSEWNLIQKISVATSAEKRQTTARIYFVLFHCFATLIAILCLIIILQGPWWQWCWGRGLRLVGWNVFLSRWALCVNRDHPIWLDRDRSDFFLTVLTDFKPRNIYWARSVWPIQTNSAM